MDFIVWSILVGGLFGWLASVMMKMDTQQGWLLNSLVGVLGAVLGGVILSPIVAKGPVDQTTFGTPAVLLALLGAVFLLAIVYVVRQGTGRRAEK